MTAFTYAPLGYRTPPEIAAGSAPASYPVAIVGAGPCGLALAIDLALHGVASVVLDENDVVSVGSRAICWAKRTLEIFDRLGVGQRMLDKGVTWKVGRLFHGDDQVYRFDLLPEDGHRMPAFVNLQQYHVEQYLVDRARDFPHLIDLRFRNRVVGVSSEVSGAVLEIETPDGAYSLRADHLVACDGSRSFVRQALGLDFAGTLFEERFLIADVEMVADFPPERWFWFDPPFHAGRSALLHKQPDNIYRIDLQLGGDADPEEERQPEKVIPRIRRVVGDREFRLDWVSVYTFQCRRMARFLHDRVIFVGDSAHVVSPFGARGGNGGIQDVDNLGWKLAAVIKGEARIGLLDTYDEERTRAADENIAHSTRATNFMTPKSTAEIMFRDAVLHFARDHDFARRLVNSGRLSSPCSLAGLSLQTASDVQGVPPGTPCPDAPLTFEGKPLWLLSLLGNTFVLLSVGKAPDLGATGLPHIRIGGPGGYEDRSGLATARYGNGMTYLIRPDQHVAAAFAAPEHGPVTAALRRAWGEGS